MLCYGLTLALLGLGGWQSHLAWPFYLGLAAAAGVAGYHYTLIKDREPAACFKAFLHNNWFGAAVFAGIAASLLPAWQ
jgi:4-hydroxybenzoate polyprenyltransferase